MRKLSIVILFLLFYKASFAAGQATQKTRNIETYVRLMGFLKYYHPVFSNGISDWDSTFIANYTPAANQSKDEALNDFLFQLLSTLNSNLENRWPVKAKNGNIEEDYQKLASIFKGLASSESIMNEIKRVLLYRRCDEQSFYITADNIGNPKYKNEKTYNDMLYPEEPYRLLALARFWNVINYLSPYKYNTDTAWDQVLVKSIPEFLSASDTIKYSNSLRHLIVMLNDSHTQNNKVYPDTYFGNFYHLPIEIIFINNKPYVSYIYEIREAVENLEVGDEITHMDGKPIDSLLEVWKNTIPASNMNKYLSTVAKNMTLSKNASKTFTIKRANKTFTSFVKASDFDFKLSDKVIVLDKLLDSNIAYIDLGVAKLSNIKKILKKYKSARGIIFDLRSYPEMVLYEICELLSSEKKKFVLWETPDLKLPGTFIKTYKYCGRSNGQSAFNGRIAILVNEKTQSLAEFTAMALQTLPNTKTIGSQTAGTDGDVSKVPFPGNYYTMITGMGVKYPEGTPTQRTGIKIDIQAYPTIQGLRNNKDEILERAIRYINDGE